MTHIVKRVFLLFLVLTGGINLEAQQVKDNKDAAFTEFGYRQGTAYRSATGKPGPNYWQNKSK